MKRRRDGGYSRPESSVLEGVRKSPMWIGGACDVNWQVHNRLDYGVTVKVTEFDSGYPKKPSDILMGSPVRTTI